MQPPPFPSDLSVPAARTARLAVTAFWGLLCLALLAPPLLAAAGQSFLARLAYAFFSPVCHQISARSFSLAGAGWAVCHRCSGIYIGSFLSCFVPAAWLARGAYSRNRRLWLAAACLPLLADVLLAALGLWSGSAPVRFGTGLLAGAAVNVVVLPAVVEFVLETRRTVLMAQVPENQGDPI